MPAQPHPLRSYLNELYTVRATGLGVGEESYYPALSNFLNHVGAALRPRVRCVFQLANRGAGRPDGGLFTPEEVRGMAWVPRRLT